MDIEHAPLTPSAPALRRFRTPIRGHAFAPPPAQVGPVGTGMQATLVREPANPADPLAVAVWVAREEGGPWRLGYLDRGVAARIAPRMDAGLELCAELEGWTPEPDGRWQRPLIALWPASVEGEHPGADEAPAAAVRPVSGAPARVSRAADPVSGAPARVSRAADPGRDARLERRLPGVRRRRIS